MHLEVQRPCRWDCRQSFTATHDMTNILSILLSLQVSLFPSFTTAFTSAATFHQRRYQQRLWRQESVSSSTRLKGTLSWSGDANASIDLISHPVVQHQDFSIRHWLDDPNASNRALLGSTEDVEEQPDGTIFCRQPPVDFLGMVLCPVFWNKISRPASGTVKVTIVDAKTEVGGGRTPNMVDQALRNIMNESKFQGRSMIQTHDDDVNNIRLSVDLKLTLKVMLPPFVLLPPGFNRVGSALIKRTGETRSKKLLRDLQREYQHWVQRKLEEQKMADTTPKPTQHLPS
jgi:hypothetical protein